MVSLALIPIAILIIIYVLVTRFQGRSIKKWSFVFVRANRNHSLGHDCLYRCTSSSGAVSPLWNTIAVAQSASYPSRSLIATAGLSSLYRMPRSSPRMSRLVFTIKFLLRFISKSLLLAQVVNLCLSLLYVSVIGDCCLLLPSSHTALVLVFFVVLTLACLRFRLWAIY